MFGGGAKVFKCMKTNNDRITLCQTVVKVLAVNNQARASNDYHKDISYSLLGIVYSKVLSPQDNKICSCMCFF